MTAPDAAPKSRNVAAFVAGVVGLVAHLGAGVFYFTSGLLAPGWAVAALIAVWVVLLVVAIVLLRTKPAYALFVPVAAVAIWFAAITAGETWLGWTA